MKEADTPWHDLIPLCRYFCFCPQHLPRERIALDRSLALTILAYRCCHFNGANPDKDMLRGLEATWRDWRIKRLHVNRKCLLLFTTGATMARWESGVANSA